MKFVEIKQFVAPATKEYYAAEYPGPGLYFNSSTLQYYCVGGSMVTGITGASFPTIQERADLDKPEAEPVHRVTEAFALRALALALNQDPATVDKALA